MAKIQFMSCG
jgi:hypothetical protein